MKFGYEICLITLVIPPLYFRSRSQSRKTVDLELGRLIAGMSTQNGSQAPLASSAKRSHKTTCHPGEWLITTSENKHNNPILHKPTSVSKYAS